MKIIDRWHESNIKDKDLRAQYKILYNTWRNQQIIIRNQRDENSKLFALIVKLSEALTRLIK